MSDAYPFTEVAPGKDGAWMVHAESRGLEAHYEIACDDVPKLAAALDVEVDRIAAGWRARGPGAGPTAAREWLEAHDVPYRTAFVWMDWD